MNLVKCSLDSWYHEICPAVSDFAVFNGYDIFDDQLAYFDEALRSIEETYSFAFAHVPLYNTTGKAPARNAELSDLLARHAVTAGFAGHNHEVASLEGPCDVLSCFLRAF